MVLDKQNDNKSTPGATAAILPAIDKIHTQAIFVVFSRVFGMHFEYYYCFYQSPLYIWVSSEVLSLFFVKYKVHSKDSAKDHKYSLSMYLINGR